jgi:hypothetical protein
MAGQCHVATGQPMSSQQMMTASGQEGLQGQHTQYVAWPGVQAAQMDPTMQVQARAAHFGMPA